MSKKYVTIDFLKGFAIFMMAFLHILTNIYDMSWVDTNINNSPILGIILLMMGLYLGAWAGLFLILNAMGNMISMYNGFEKGRTVKETFVKQMLGGFILLIFAYLAEGIFQYYGVFVSYYEGNPDPFRAIWHAYTMETIHTIAYCMILNAIVQCLLSINGGHRKIKRNMIIYVLLAVISFIITQPIWDWAKMVIPEYPFINSRPTVDSSFSDYMIKLVLLPLAGSPEPVFPFFAVSCIGSILGMGLARENVSRKFPQKAIFAGIGLFVVGAIIGILVNAGFDEFLPLEHFSAFVKIGNGLGYKWVPWICFITAGQIIVVSTVLRLVEFRGKSEKFAAKTKLIRRFGIVPFSIYCWHRIFAIVPLEIINAFWHKDSYIYCECYTGYQSLAIIAIIMIFIHFLLRIWEKVNYIGSLEWMMATIGIYVAKKQNMPGIAEKPWYKKGELNAENLFYQVEWIDVFSEEALDRSQQPDSKLALIYAILGVVMFPCGFLALDLANSAQKSEGKNKKNTIAKIWAIIDIILVIAISTILYILTLADLGVSL